MSRGDAPRGQLGQPAGPMGDDAQTEERKLAGLSGPGILTEAEFRGKKAELRARM